MDNRDAFLNAIGLIEASLVADPEEQIARVRALAGANDVRNLQEAKAAFDEINDLAEALIALFNHAISACGPQVLEAVQDVRRQILAFDP